MALLETQGLSINFGGLWAVKDVAFSIDQRQIIGLIGPNGCLKTTFLNIVSGIYKASRGKVILNNEDITTLKPFEIYKKGIARTYQSSRLCWDLSVADNLLVGMYTSQKSTFADTIFHPQKTNLEIDNALEECLTLLSFFNPELINKRNVLTKNIPHIDRRRIEITRALVGKPHVLLFDEPTAGLNDEETMTMMHDIRKIKGKLQDIAIIIIEHDMKVMKEVPERIVVFNAGEKIAEGTYDAVVRDLNVINAYLGGAKV